MSLRSRNLREKQSRSRKLNTNLQPHGIATSRASRNPRNDDEFSWPSNFTFIPLNLPRLFTQVGLALHSWVDQLDLLWVPAHTLPVFGNPKLPMVVTIHGVEFQHLPKAYIWGQNFHLTWSTRWACYRANKIITVSNSTKRDLIDWLHIGLQKIEVIYEGVDLEKFRTSQSVETRRRLVTRRHMINHMPTITRHATAQFDGGAFLQKYKIHKPYILFVGTIQPRKNLVRLIEAFSVLASRTRHFDSAQCRHLEFRRDNNLKLETRNLQLVIAGKPGWDYQEILTAPKAYGVGDRVKFLGYVPDSELPDLYRNASLYIEPSLQEGFGLPVLEAMASGVPVVAANAGALPEVVGDASILVNPLSISSLVEGLASGLGIRASLSSQSLHLPPGTSKLSTTKFRQELISRGYQRAAQFNWKDAACRLVSLFHSLDSSKA